MTGLKGILGIIVMVTVGVAVFIILAAVKISLLSLRYLSRRVLDQF